MQEAAVVAVEAIDAIGCKRNHCATMQKKYNISSEQQSKGETHMEKAKNEFSRYENPYIYALLRRQQYTGMWATIADGAITKRIKF